MSEDGKIESAKGIEIRENAFALIMKNGYSKTSYADIARKSNCTRALVQYYFPKKTLIMKQFVTRLLELTDTYAKENSLITGSQFVDIYLTGSMHFYFLLKNEELIALTRDIVSNRDYSMLAIEIMAGWQRHFNELDAISDADIMDAALLAVGGAYELIKHHLEYGIDIDIPLLMKRTIRTYIVNLDRNPEDFLEHIMDVRVSEEELAKANRYIIDRMVQH